MPDRAKVGFRPLRTSDLPLMRRWLTADHVRRWWDPDKDWTDETVAQEYAPMIEGTESTAPFAITYDGVDIRYIQTSKIADHPGYARHVAVDEDAAGVDLFIGEPDYLHRELGAHIVRTFLRDIVFGFGDAVSCVIGPEPANTAAIRAYRKAGFRYLKTIQVPDESSPEYLMRIAREDVSGDRRSRHAR